MVSPGHQRVVDRFVEDLAYAVEHAAPESKTKATYGDDVSLEAAGAG
jgi:hypothetical protein